MNQEKLDEIRIDNEIRINDLATAIDIINEFDGTDDTYKLRQIIRKEIEKLEALTQ